MSKSITRDYLLNKNFKFKNETNKIIRSDLLNRFDDFGEPGHFTKTVFKAENHIILADA